MVKTTQQIQAIIGLRAAKTLCTSMKKHNQGVLKMTTLSMLSHGKIVPVIRDVLHYDIEQAIEAYRTAISDVTARNANVDRARTVWIKNWNSSIVTLQHILDTENETRP